MAIPLQDREGEDGAGPNTQHDRGGASPGVPSQPQAGHQQGTQGQIQVPSEILPQRSILCREFCSHYVLNFTVCSCVLERERERVCVCVRACKK